MMFLQLCFASCQMALPKGLEVQASYLTMILTEEGPQLKIERK